MATIRALTSIEFGAGIVQLPPAVLHEPGRRRPLPESDRGIGAAGLLDWVCTDLPAAA